MNSGKDTIKHITVTYCDISILLSYHRYSGSNKQNTATTGRVEQWSLTVYEDPASALLERYRREKLVLPLDI